MNNFNPQNIKCKHNNVKREAGFIVCQECGVVLDQDIDFANIMPMDDHYKDSQIEYERNIRIRDSKAKQDPIIKQKYDRLKTLEKWYRDYQTSFSEQRKTIELLKGYGININSVKFEAIKKRYLRYNRKHRRTYQNMVIIFLTIIWMEIKDTSNIRIEKYIDISNQLGHKINKKMLNNAMLKIKKTEDFWKKLKTKQQIENEIKNRIKILFEKNLNNISFDKVKNYISNKNDYNRLRIEMQLMANELLDKISYSDLRNLNYKAFTAGLIYYIGQCLNKGRYSKVFTQNLIEEASKFSSTTIRKKYHVLKNIMGDCEDSNKTNF